ncbi:MAG: DUF669 domain-containing protein [Planctomycetota bacterium]|jgi:hypothetical protein
MELDFSRIEDVEDFLAVPPGEYDCRVVEVREGWTRQGDSRWSLRLEVAEGEYAGKAAAWDFLSFGERGVRRAQAVLSAFGFQTAGKLELEPDDLVGRTACVRVIAEERVDALTGARQVRPRVPYDGYSPASPF